MLSIRNYINITKDKVIIEYTLIDKINDTNDDSIRLVNLLSPIRNDIELQFIPLNESTYIPFVASKNIIKFADVFIDNGFETIIKPSRGSDIDAGCGQLVAGISNY